MNSKSDIDFGFSVPSTPIIPKYIKFSGLAISEGEEKNIGKTENIRANVKHRYAEYHKRFERAARSEPLEYGIYSACDGLIAEWSLNAGSNFGDIIQSIYLESISNKICLLALIKAISAIEYDLVYPSGQLIALAALSHQDIEVIEAGIRAYEHWETKKGVLALKNCKTHVEWLDEYRRETLEHLESI